MVLPRKRTVEYLKDSSVGDLAWTCMPCEWFDKMRYVYLKKGTGLLFVTYTLLALLFTVRAFSFIRIALFVVLIWAVLANELKSEGEIQMGYSGNFSQVNININRELGE